MKRGQNIWAQLLLAVHYDGWGSGTNRLTGSVSVIVTTLPKSTLRFRGTSAVVLLANFLSSALLASLLKNLQTLFGKIGKYFGKYGVVGKHFIRKHGLLS